MKKTFVKMIGAVTLAALSTVSAVAATTGFNQTGAGPYDYNDAANWVGSSINGIWDSSLTLTAGQTVTFATPTTLSTGLTFNYGGNFALTLQASAAGTQNLTLGGDVGLNTGGGTTANVTIGNSANHLNVDLGGANRTFTVATNRTLTLVDVLSGSGFGITNAGAGTLALNGANTYDGGATLNAGAINFANNAAFGTGTITANGGTIKTTAGVTTTNNLVVNGATTLDVTGGNWTLNGNISGSGAITRGTGATLTLYLGGDNSGYTGTFTSPNNGNAVVRFTSASAGSAGASWVFNNATAARTTLEWTANGGVGTISFGSLTGGGQIQNNTSGTKTISAGALGLTDTFSGILAANGANTLAFTKVGSGTMTLSGVNTYTGDTTISGGALTIGGAGRLGGGFYPGAIINNGSFTYSSSAAQTLAGPISGSGNLTNSGSGALTLSGVCSFTGSLTANAGTLILANPQSFSLSTVVVNDGATLSETFSPSVQMTASSLTLGLTTGATNAFVPNSTSVARISAGTLTLNGVNTINITGGNLAVGSSYPLITYTTLAGAGSYTLGTLPAGVGGNLSTVGNTIYFNVTGVTNTVWTGAVNGTWDITTANWTNTGTFGNTYVNGSPVQFDDTGLNTTTISNSVATTVSPISVLVTNNVSNYAFKANVIIAGAASLTKTGTANLTNSTANTYTGPTAINKGQLVVGVASVANTSGALGNNSAVSLANDSTAVLNLNNFATQIGSLSGGGASGGNVNLGSATLTLGADNTSTTYAGTVSGINGGLTKIGTGTQTLSGTNTYSGGTRANAGVLALSGSRPNQAGNNDWVSVNNVGSQNATLKIVSGADWGIRDFNIGEAGGSLAAVYQSGTLTADNGVFIGNGGSSYAYYNLSGGTLGITGNDLAVGRGNSSIGVMDVTGGSLNASSWIVLGRNGGTASGLLNVTGGSVSSGANNIALNWGGSAGAISILNVGGGTGAASVTGVNNAGNALDVSVANVAGQIGVVNVRSNGTLTVPKVQVGGANSTALFNFNGGTLKATTNNAGANFMNSGNMDAVTVYSGGGTIDNNGTSITIGNALGAATGNGVTSIAVTDGGSGYIGAPLVKFTDGTGDPATGYAVMTDDLTGNGTYKVSSIVISSPGTYSVDPTTATLSGGGATTAATLGTITTAANTSGGMTFQGSGTTTLTGNLSYGGGTKVLGGTLVLNAGTGLPNPGGDLVVSNATLNLDASSGTMSANNVSVGSTLNLTVSPSANAINGTGNMAVGNNTTNNLTYGTVSFAPSAAVIKVTGTLTKGTNIVFNISATGLQPGWIVPLVQADSTAMTTNGFVLGTLPAGIKAVLTNSTANTLDLLVTSAGQLLTWRGSEDGITPAINWDIATSTNWYSLPSSAPAKYQQYLGNTIGDNVTFGDYALNTDGTNHVNLTTTVVPATVIFSSSTPYELHGPGGIGGATSVVLTNNYAAVYLNTSNSYTGGTIVSGGTLVITNNNALGATSGGLTMGGGTLQLDAPVTTSRAVTVTSNSTISVAANATAQLSGNFSGAGIALTVSGSTYSGATAGSAGTFNLTGSGTNTILTVGTYSGNTLLNLSTDRSANSMLVGNAGVAAVSQTGGNVTVNGGGGDCLSVGNIAGAFGYYNMQGGTLTANGIAVGGENNNGSGFSGTGGDGIMEINGGTVNNIGWLVMARGVTAEMGVLNIFSGSLTYAGGGLQCNWGAGQTSIINIMGGSVSSTNTPVNFINAGNTGILNLKGGILQPSAVTGSGILNFNGGTLKSIANNNNFVNVTRANVYSGGATIDDGGYSITINKPLLAPEAYGVSSISLSDGGSGYIAPPIVIISGGTGSNATAIATISGGSVTGITVTSPGSGYDSGDVLSVSFTGGGASVTQPTVSAVNLAPNTSGGLTKLGSGTLTLNGANTYTGNTVINAGKLFVTSAHQATNSVTVTNGATYGVSLTGAPVSITNRSITLASGSTTLSFGLGTNGNLAAPLIVCGPLTNNGTLNVVVGGNSSLLTVGSAIPLVKYSGSIAGAGSLNPTIAAPRGASLTLSNDVTGHILYAVVNAAGGGIVWTGTNSAPGLANLWDLNSTTNWLFGGSPTTYQETIPPGDIVTFNDLGSGTVLLSNTVSPASVTISNSAVNYTFQGTGSISGTTALTKQGSNNVTMSLANTFSGGVTLNSGTLTYGNATALGSGTATLAGGTLKNGNFNIANNISVSGSTMFDVNGFNSTWSGNISGSAALTVTNAGNAATLSLSGTNSGYGGTITFNNNCAVDFKSADAGSANAAWVFNDGNAARVRINAGNNTINFGSLAGVGQIVNNTASSTSILSVGALNTTTTFGGTIKDNGTGILALTKVGTGTLSVTGVNAYTGGTVIDAGTLAISSALTGSTATGVLTVNEGGTLLITVSGTGTNQLTPSSLTVGSSTGATLAFSNVTSTALAPLNPTNLVITGTATINIGSLASLTTGTYPLVTNYTAGTVVLGTLPPNVNAHLSTADNQISLVVDSIAVNYWAVGNGSWDSTSFNWKTNGVAARYADSVQVIFDDTASGTGTILVTNTPSAVSPGSVTVNVTNKNYAIYGLAIAGSGALTKNGNGTLTLANTNTYSGGTTINGGTLQLGDGTANNGVVAGNVTNNGTLTFANPSAQTNAGVVSGTGAVTKTGSGTLTLTAQNTFTGGTVVNNGTLALASGGAIGTVRGTLTVNAGATASLTVVDALGYNNDATRVSVVNINGGTVDDATSGNQSYRTSYNLTGGSITSSGGGSFNFTTGQSISNLASSVSSTISAPIMLRDGTSLAIGVAAGTVPSGIDLGISGAIVNGGGGGGITKSGLGQLVLSGTNTYTGATTVSGGTLRVNGSIASGAVTVDSGATLGGTGTVNGAVTVNAGGALSPGASVGTLTISNNLALAGNLFFELNKSLAPGLTNDYVIVSGTLTNTGTGTLTLTNVGPALVAGDTFKLFSQPLSGGELLTIAPPLPGSLAWTNNLAVDGTVAVISTSSAPTPAQLTNSVSGGVLSLTWPAGQGWKLQVQTNSRSVGLKTNWFDVPGSTSLSGTNITLDRTQPTIFYRLAYP